MTPRTLPGPIRSPAPIKALRTAVAGLGTTAAQNVSVVRQAFVTSVAPLPTFSSGSKSDFINRFAAPGVGAAIISSTALFGLSTAVVTAPVPPPRPELDAVEIGNDRSKGVLDSFFARVVFSMASSDLPRVSYFRVLRARGGRVAAPTPSFSAIADSTPLGARSKSFEMVSNSAFRASEIGVGNALTRFIADDRFSGQRVVVSSSSLRPLPPVLNTNRRGTSAAGLVSVPNGDRSVIENIDFYVNQRTISPRVSLALPLNVGQRQGINVLQGSSVGSSTSIVSVGNAAGFSEVARIPASKGTAVGSFAEFEYIDPSVVYGSSYSYYVVAVSSVGFESVRTRIVDAQVVRSIPPPTPDVMFAVLGEVPRFTIACSGSFTDHVEVFRRGGTVPEQVRLLSTQRSMIDRGVPVLMDSGFYHIGDVGIGPARHAPFVDRNVSPGQSLEYRIYAVDSFGLKSATPFSCSVFLPDHGKVVPLQTPSITAEQVIGDRVLRISVTSEDPRVTSFVLARRELTTRERSYKQPNHPAYFTLGTTTPIRARSRSGPSISGFSSKVWNGILRAVSGSAQFDDTAIEFDRVYQYSVRGIDLRGNSTADSPSTPVFVAVKPVADAPVAVTGTLLTDQSGNPAGVLVEWSVGTLDFSPLELLGDQDVLAATSQRSVFQVERRLAGTPAWSALPATTATHFIDPVSQAAAPRFRAGYAELNAAYDYRVIAMQSGAFISAHTDPVRVIVTPEIFPPSLIAVRSSPTSLRPLSIVVSWQYNGSFVDGWEIERAVTNKVYGARVPSMDSALARGLSYSGVGRITRESSRALGISSVGRALDPRIFVGNRFFIDRDVSMANSYFYRVRAFDIKGRTSDWTYGGILLTDSPFDRKFMSTLSDNDKSSLALDSRPIPGWEGR
jgi:hypothetical protein